MGDIGSLKKLSDVLLPKKMKKILEINNVISLHPYLNNLSIKAYSLFQNVCFNYCGSTNSFLMAKEGSLKREKIPNQICVSVLQNEWVTLSPFHALVFYKVDG